MKTTPVRETARLHLRYEGRSYDLSMADLALEPWAAADEVRRTLARQMDLSVSILERYVVERHANGNLTVRPEAVFG